MRVTVFNKLSWIRVFLLWILVFFGISSGLWANVYEEKYGPELKSVPYAYRVKFYNDYNKPWSEATYDERYDFIDVLSQAEIQRKIEEQNKDLAEEMVENAKLAQRQAEKMAIEQKELEKQTRKNDEKNREQMKKFERQMKSMEQKQKILEMRYRQNR